MAHCIGGRFVWPGVASPRRAPVAGALASAAPSRLTIHSSRSHFAARLNSSVGAHMRPPALVMLLSSLAVCMAACSAAPSKSVAPKPQLPLARTKAECLAQGGQWGWPGIPHQEEPDDFQGTCIRRTSDAGKVCTSSNDCQGLCLATSESAVTRSGICAGNTFGSGCRATVEEGAPSPVICVD